MEAGRYRTNVRPIVVSQTTRRQPREILHQDDHITQIRNMTVHSGHFDRRSTSFLTCTLHMYKHRVLRPALTKRCEASAWARGTGRAWQLKHCDATDPPLDGPRTVKRAGQQGHRQRSNRTRKTWSREMHILPAHRHTWSAKGYVDGDPY